jgi:hypothetical protein
MKYGSDEDINPLSIFDVCHSQIACLAFFAGLRDIRAAETVSLSELSDTVIGIAMRCGRPRNLSGGCGVHAYFGGTA